MTKFGMHQSISRIEDPRLLTGRGRYTDDIVLPGQGFGFVLRSPHAHARIRAIDTAAARAMPGVLGIFTHADLAAEGIGHLPCVVGLKNKDGSRRADTPRPALADGVVRHVGDAVAFVVAKTLAAARDAAEAITVEYELLPASTDLATAAAPGQAQVWPATPNNVCFDWQAGDAAGTAAAFARAAHVTRLEVVNNRIVVASMEARAANAAYDPASGRFTLYSGTQGSWLLKDQLASAIFKLPPENFRVVTPDVGGGFGMKIFLYPEHVLCCFAARRLNRAVKWTSERSEAFLSDTHGRDNITLAELALDAEGRFLALRTRNVANMGAYLSTFAPFIPTFAGSKVLASVYRFGAIHAQVLGMFTHTVPVDAYRGAGRPESNYLVERLIDQAARELGIDRIELRRRNMVAPADMPWKSAMGATYDTGDFPAVLEAGLHAADWAGFAARRAASARAGRLRGIGLAYYLEATGGGATERAEIRFAADGMAELLVGTQSTGQGHETAYVQIMAERLGIPAGRLRVVQGDSDAIPTGGGTGGARSLYSQGGAILAAAQEVENRGRKGAAHILEAAAADIEFADGFFRIAGTDRQLHILDLAAEARSRKAAGEAVETLDAFAVWDIKAHTFPNGCHIAEVEVDPETGRVALARYTVADDVGRAINPLIVRGQVHGGVAQGVGQALLECTHYDAVSGQLVAGSFMDYALPRADDLPAMAVELVEVPCGTNPLGVKGAGEAGAVGSPPAVINALVDALAARGVGTIDMPATPERVWRALAAKAA
ncbi:MAG: xanthine dehydrogenase family protein molybdopterin-binding subunit [Alphaproteobacteria bacterium]|nr:xanthine dehydrogenase family protein molybdopterin-binding subunit [Alphaproteobacteria bacterium]